MDIKKILVVGYGSMGRRRIRLVRRLVPTAEIICLDSNSDRIIKAEEDGCVSVSSIDEGVRHKPDVAFVCTSPGSHLNIILKLLSSGIHVFSELNLSTKGYDDIEKLARDNNVVCFLSSTLIYKRQMEIIDEIVSRQNKPLTYVYHVGQYLPDWHPWENYKDFFVSKKETNAIRELLAIQLPWIIRTFGKVKEVNVLFQKCTNLDINYPDSAIVLIAHENGTIGSFTVDVVSRKAMTKLEIIGESVHVIWGGHNDDLYEYNIETKEMNKLKVYDIDEHVDGYSENISEEPYLQEIIEFFNTINGVKPKYDINDDTYVLNLIDIIESDKSFSIMQD